MMRFFVICGRAALSLSVLSCAALIAPTASAQTVKVRPAQQCLSDLRAFDSTLQKDGYWLHGSGYGYGYPAYSYGPGTLAPITDTPSNRRYLNARPGYEVRMLIASANILAQRGQQAACETVLTASKSLYASYASNMREGKFPRADNDSWRRAQIASAQPVTDNLGAYRSDQLVGTELVNPKGENLGSISDIVLDPQTGKVAYLVIGRGGLFGFDQKYTPVPWTDFKATTGTSLLVLNATKAEIEDAPKIQNDSFSSDGDFAGQSGKVDGYWLAHVPK